MSGGAPRNRYQELTPTNSFDRSRGAGVGPFDGMAGFDSREGGARGGADAAAQQSGKDESKQETEAVLRRTVPWDTYQKADLISDRELQLIRRYDKKPRDARRALLVEDGPLYATAFLSLLRSIASEEVVQYVLALVEEMVVDFAGEPEVGVMDAFAGAGAGAGEVAAILMRMLQRPDWFTKEKASFVLASFLAHGATGVPSAAASGFDDDVMARTHAAFAEWLVGELRRPSSPRAGDHAVTCLSLLLRSRDDRTLLVRLNGVAPLLAAVDRAAVTCQTQTLYEACLCVWLLSFLPDAAAELVRLGAPRKLLDAVKSSVKEKVVRAALAALQNLLERAKAQDANAGTGPGGGGPKLGLVW